MPEYTSWAQIQEASGGRVPGPPDGQEPTFAEPWQSQVFAMTVALHERGVFTWSQWAQSLGERLDRGADDGSDYYRSWCAALVDLLEVTGAVSPGEVQDLERAWHAAAARTPHGQPITLGER